MNHRTLTVTGLLAAYNHAARRDAEILLAHCLGKPRSALLAHPEAGVGVQVAEQFVALLKRRTQGEPVAYLLGEKEFWSLALKVTPDVLVPRPETEILIETVLAATARDSRLNVLDLGTGSGAIALALAQERPHWNITATDRYPAAIAIARDNATRLGHCSNLGRIEFITGDWFQPLGKRRFDLIASNPPYIATGDPVLATPELTFEPQAALIAGPTGIEALAHIAARAPRHLTAGGRILLEHGSDQAPVVRSLLETAGFSTIRTHQDLAGHERVTAAQIFDHDH
jgi:release factor glutamine methyltransferase